MTMRWTRSTVTFLNPFTLPGFPESLPAGDYLLLVEEELIHELSFDAYRLKTTFLTVHGKKGSGRTELRAVSASDLQDALIRDFRTNETNNHRKTTLSAQEDLK